MLLFAGMAEVDLTGGFALDRGCGLQADRPRGHRLDRLPGADKLLSTARQKVIVAMISQRPLEDGWSFKEQSVCARPIEVR